MSKSISKNAALAVRIAKATVAYLMAHRADCLCETCASHRISFATEACKVLDSPDSSNRTEGNMTKEIEAAKGMDWGQVVMNGGPPCFHVQEDGRFCGRAERWDGHRLPDFHDFVSLADLLETVRTTIADV